MIVTPQVVKLFSSSLVSYDKTNLRLTSVTVYSLGHGFGMIL